MKIFNTLTRTKEDFVPIKKGKASIYACGPTVYNYIHIGNARPVCVFDVLRRYLEWLNYDVTFVQNFTDIDDKIINRANDEGTSYDKIAEKFIVEFLKDADGMNVKRATIYPKATENIDGMIDMIKSLIEKGYAYNVDGDVYFSSTKFDGYGKLSHQNVEDLQMGARVDVQADKKEPMDFALWKKAKEGEPFWESPWGNGRPGWHIECSVMAQRFLGETLDIHGGGEDLIFPHHENEIAQSESCYGKTFANYWMHNGYINVDNIKMSKSLDNFFTVRDVAEKYGYEPIRYLMISAHYRTPINYSIDVIEQCKSSLDRLYNAQSNVEFALKNAEERALSKTDETILEKIYEKKDKFISGMNDDLNTAEAMGAVFEIVNIINTDILDKNPAKEVCRKALSLFNELAGVLGLLYVQSGEVNVDDEIQALIDERQVARAVKNFARADEIRTELLAKDIVLDDTPSGVKWQRKK